MIQHTCFVNATFTSNTFILSQKDEDAVWIVDPGDVKPIWVWMNTHTKTAVAGILLTHTHFDHIYGVNDILEKFPECIVYVANEYGKEGLSNTKQNGSKYTGNPIIIQKSNNIRFFEKTTNLWSKFELKSFITPGHSDDSICFIVQNLLFTGDTLIKDVRTVTKIRGGSVEKLNNTIHFLEQFKGQGYHVCPGHGEEFEFDEYDLIKSVYNKNSNISL